MTCGDIADTLVEVAWILVWTLAIVSTVALLSALREES